MTPQKGQYVKVIFRNATQLEGFVDSWSSVKSILRSQDGQSFCVIMRTDEDVMITKIMTSAPATFNGLRQELGETEKEFQQVVEGPSDDELRIAKLAKLRQLMAEQESKIVSNKLKSHAITNVRKQEYGLPQFFKK